MGITLRKNDWVNSTTKSNSKLIIFDYDGVIVDSYPGVYEAWKTIGIKMNKKIPKTFEEFKKIHLESYLDAFTSVGILTHEEIAQADKIFAEEIITKMPKTYSGIKETLQELSKKYILAVVSANNKGEVLDKLTNNDLFHYFDYIYAKHDFVNHPMKKESAINYLLAKLRLPKENAVLIGDRNDDYFDAKKAGLDKILLVDYGWGYSKDKTPDRIKFDVKEPKDIIGALKFIDF